MKKLEVVEKFLSQYPLVREETLAELEEYLKSKNWHSLAEAAKLIKSGKFSAAMEKISEEDISSTDEERRNISILLWAQPLIYFVAAVAERGSIREETDILYALLEVLRNVSGKFREAVKTTGSFLTLVLLESFIKRVNEKNVEEAVALILLSRETATLSENEELIKKVEELVGEISG